MIDALMWAFTALVLPGLLLVPPLLFARGRRREAGFLLLIMLTAGLLAVEIQFITLRPRPDGEPLQFGAYFPSFPSGHAAIAFAWATFLALLDRGRRAALPALLTASLVAYSRVHLGHHHPSDVILGAVLGAATAAIGYGGFYLRSSPSRPRWAWWLWPQLALVIFAGVGAYLGLTHFAFLQLPYLDKVMHFVLFGALAFFLMAWFHQRPALLIGSALAAIGIFDETMQALSPSRTFDLLDLVCTLSGIALACLLANRLRLITLPSDTRARVVPAR